MNLSLDAQGFPLAEGGPLALPPKPRAVLALLIERRPAVVSKQAFAELAWGGRPMSDESLARCISLLRRMLPAGAIESVYGHGYRLAPLPQSVPVAPAPAPSRAPSPAVMDAWLHARQLAQSRSPAALHRAAQLLRRIVAEQPGFAAARVSLAQALAASLSWGLLPGPDVAAEGFAHLESAERIAPDVPGLVSTRAWLLDLSWRFEAADALHRQALQRKDDPEALFLYGWHLVARGRPHEALPPLRKALAEQPYSAPLRLILARALAHSGELAAALAEIDACCHEHPGSTVAACYRLGIAAALRPGSGLAEAMRQLAQGPDAPPFAQGVLSYALARDGQVEAARAVIATAPSHAPCQALHHAPALAALGELEAGSALLEAAFAVRCGALPMALGDPANAPLLALPRVRALPVLIFRQAIWARRSRGSSCWKPRGARHVGAK